MTFHIAGNAPGNSLDAVTQHLSDPDVQAFLEDFDFAALAASDAYPVHYVTLDDLLKGNLPGAPAHWRHLIVQGGASVADADLAGDGGRVVAVHRGPRAAGTARAFDQAGQLDREYELRMLEGPAIHLVSVWLHADDDDVLIPIEPDDTGLPLYQPIALSNALPMLRDIAMQLEQDIESEPGPSGT